MRKERAATTATVNRVAVRTLDITGLTCPRTRVRTRLELERLAPVAGTTIRIVRR
jgi:TusA-related sulfurtransferase